MTGTKQRIFALMQLLISATAGTKTQTMIGGQTNNYLIEQGTYAVLEDTLEIVVGGSLEVESQWKTAFLYLSNTKRNKIEWYFEIFEFT